MLGNIQKRITDFILFLVLVVSGFTSAFLIYPEKVQAVACQRVQANCGYIVIGS